MKELLNDLVNRIKGLTERITRGRYGSDEFSRFLTKVALVFILVSFLGYLFSPLLLYLYIPGIFLWIYSMFRYFSKNVPARMKERELYFRARGGVSRAKSRLTRFFRLQKRRWQDRHICRYYRCPSCRAVVRVPKGRGKKSEIRCPRCNERFIRRP